MTPNAIKELKEAMGYRGSSQCCSKCRHFVPADCSGSSKAKPQHCTLTPAVDLPVDETGFCNHFDAKTPQENLMNINLNQLAGQLYTTYCTAVGGVAFNGDPLPSWEEFSKDPAKKKQADAWISTALASLRASSKIMRDCFKEWSAVGGNDFEEFEARFGCTIVNESPDIIKYDCDLRKIVQENALKDMAAETPVPTEDTKLVPP